MFAEALERKQLDVTPHTLVDRYQQSIQWHHIIFILTTLNLKKCVFFPGLISSMLLPPNETNQERYFERDQKLYSP